MTLPPNSLPIRIHFAPGHTRHPDLVCPFPDSDILFLGWGSINGPEQWPDDPRALSVAMRQVLLGVAKTRTLAPHQKVVVLGCERRNGWLKEKPTRWSHIDTMLMAIYQGMKAVYGIATPVAFSGPEDLWGDLYTPMIGMRTHSTPQWDRCLPFISPIYGSTPDHAADIIIRLASGPGVPHGICLWCQAHDLAGQQATVDFGLAVNELWLKHLAAVSAAEGEVSE